MCMVVDKEITEKVQRRLNKHGEIRCWRLCERIPGKLRSPWQHSIMRIGKNISNRKNTKIFAKDSNDFRDYNGAIQIIKGRHVFLRRQDVRNAKCDDCDDRIIPVICKEKDFVAAGHWFTNKGNPAAVFMSIYIDKMDYDKALGKKGK